jgi:hypothetical protein
LNCREWLNYCSVPGNSEKASSFEESKPLERKMVEVDKRILGDTKAAKEL